MKKIIALLLTLSLLLCVNATVFAAEGDDGSNEPATTVADVSETDAGSTTEEKSDPTEDPNEAETFSPAEQSEESETSEPAEESGTPETTEPTDESTAPEGDVSSGDSEVSQEPTDNEENDNMQPASPGNAERVTNGEILGDSPVARNATFNVTVTWTGMSFTYHEKPKGQWDPTHLTYGDDGQHSWTSSDIENPSCGTITVTVNSDIGDLDLVTASFRFTKEASFTPTVRMRFSDTKENVSSGGTTGSLEFDVDTEKEQSMYVIPASGTLTSADFENAQNKLGIITVTITAEELHDPSQPEQPGIE